MSGVGLILEGGGMRGAFTAGVLDLWMEKGLWLSNVYGVSAGACQACSYLGGQIGRGLRVWTDYIGDWRYCSLRSLIATGDLFGAELNYDLVPNRYDPLDDAAFQRRNARFIAVVTRLDTGQAEYMRVRDLRRDVRMVRASASLPLISNPVEIGGRLYLDGGIADSIPLKRSMADGHRKNVVVLTREAGYRKSPARAMPLIAARYRRYPRFVEAMRNRSRMYNAQLELVAAEEAAGRAFVLRPETAPQIGRIEKDPEKLRALHAAGYAAADRAFERLTAFLNE